MRRIPDSETPHSWNHDGTSLGTIASSSSDWMMLTVTLLEVFRRFIFGPDSWDALGLAGGFHSSWSLSNSYISLKPSLNLKNLKVKGNIRVKLAFTLFNSLSQVHCRRKLNSDFLHRAHAESTHHSIESRMSNLGNIERVILPFTVETTEPSLLSMPTAFSNSFRVLRFHITTNANELEGDDIPEHPVIDVVLIYSNFISSWISCTSMTQNPVFLQSLEPVS